MQFIEKTVSKKITYVFESATNLKKHPIGVQNIFNFYH